jgi:hypothetical protein
LKFFKEAKQDFSRKTTISVLMASYLEENESLSNCNKIEQCEGRLEMNSICTATYCAKEGN